MPKVTRNEPIARCFLKPNGAPCHHHSRSGSAPCIDSVWDNGDYLHYHPYRRHPPSDPGDASEHQGMDSVHGLGVAKSVISHSADMALPMERVQRRQTRRISLLALGALAVIAGLSWLARRDGFMEHIIGGGSTHIREPLPLLPGTEADGEGNPSAWIGHTLAYAAGVPDQLLEATHPKAVVMSLVTEQDLVEMTSTVANVDEQFNHHHGYDWVFFSPSSLSDNFRTAVSNATPVTCIFESLTAQNWSLSSSLDMARVEARWNSGLFTQERRRDNYDFWRVNPGTLFSKPIQHDLFKFMQDNNIPLDTNCDVGPLLKSEDDLQAESHDDLEDESRDYLADDSDEGHEVENDPESLTTMTLDEMWEELDARVAGLEMSQLESGQTFSFLRKAEQEGARIDFIPEEEETILALPDSPMEREIEFAGDLYTEQFLRKIRGST